MRTILIAIGDDRLRLATLRHIEAVRPDYAVRHTGDAAQARAWMGDMRADLVIAESAHGRMLDFAGWVQRTQQCQMILLCGVDTFAAAQRVVRPGSVDYLFEPYHAEELTRLLGVIEERVQAMREQGVVLPIVHQQEDERTARMERMLPGLAGDTLEQDEREAFAAFVSSAPGVCIVAELRAPGHDAVQAEQALLLLKDAMAAYLRAGRETVIAVEAGRGRLLGLVLLQAHQTAEWVREQLTALSAYRTYMEEAHADFGVSMATTGLPTYGARAYEQAVAALAYRFYEERDAIVLYEDNAVALKQDTPFFQPMVQRVEAALHGADGIQLDSAVDALFEQICSWPRPQPQRVLRQVHRLVQRLIFNGEHALDEAARAALAEQAAADIRDCRTVFQVRQAVRETLRKLLRT